MRVPIEFEPSPACFVCGGTASETLERYWAMRHVLRYVACTGCGLVRMNPRPKPESLDHFYAHTYLSSGSRDIPKRRAKQEDFARFLVYVLASHVEMASIKRLMDVGCAYGDTIRLIKVAIAAQGGNGVEAFAVEPSEDARKIASPVCTLIGRTIADIPQNNGRYDVIVLSHVLEHMVDPVGTLELLREQLSESGRIVLEVPNLYAHPSVDIVHNFLFTPISLRNVAARSGLAVDAIYETDHSSTSRPLYITAVLKPHMALPVTPETMAEIRASRARAFTAFGAKPKVRILGRIMLLLDQTL